VGLKCYFVVPSNPLEHAGLEKYLCQGLLLWYVTNTVHGNEMVVDRRGCHGVVVVCQECPYPLCQSVVVALAHILWYACRVIRALFLLIRKSGKEINDVLRSNVLILFLFHRGLRKEVITKIGSLY
jgi:hypothetical protein